MKNTTSWIVGLIVLIGVGFASYKAGQHSVPAMESEASVEAKVKNDLVNLTQKDFEEYKNLKTMEDRYKKADEILGKIVTVFLADLGLKLGYKPSNPALLDGACAIPGLAVTPSPIPSATPQQSNMSAAPTPSPSPTPNKTPAWILNEKRLANLDNEEDILRNLKKTPIDDVFSTLKSAEDITHDEALSIEGRFQGEIHFFDRKKHNTDWILYWEIALAAGNKASASSLISLTKKSTGETFSRSRGNQVLKNFIRADGSKALIVNVYGDDGYIQIYPVGGNDHWVGNYYEKGKIGEYKFTGQVSLNRLQ